MPARKNVRKREADSESDDDGQHIDLAKVRELREEQKYRSKAAGIDSVAAAKSAPTSAAVAVESAEPKAVTTTTIETGIIAGGLAGHFSSGGMIGESIDTSEDPLMLQYVEDKLKELQEAQAAAAAAPDNRAGWAKAAGLTSLAKPTNVGDFGFPGAGGPSGGNRDSVRPEEILENPDKLYELPEHLRYKAGKRREDADVGSGGQMLGGTGIAEVLLPEEFREKNTKETEMLRGQILAKRARMAADASGTRGPAMGPALPSSGDGDLDDADGGGGGGAGAGGGARYLTGSYTANYSHHRREFAMMMKGKPTAGAGTALFDQRPLPGQQGYNARGGGYGAQDGRTGPSAGPPGHGGGGRGGGGQHSGRGGHDRRDMPSDDRLFNTFRKREIASLRNK